MSVKTRAKPPQKIAKSRTARKPKSAASPAPAKPKTASEVSTRSPTKRDQLAALLIRDEGATIDQMIAATGWLPHTVRAAMTGLKKLGYTIDSDKIDGLRTYRAVAPE